MGLTSSQGRLLMLTSRLSDIEYSEILLSQRQNTLAMRSEKVAKEYNEAMNNYKLTVKVTDTSKDSGYSIKDINYTDLTSMGYLITDVNNTIYLTKDGDNYNIPKDIEGNDLFTIEGDDSEHKGEAKINDKYYKIADGSEYLTNSKLLQNAIANGTLFIFNTLNDTPGITINTLPSSSDIEYVLDTSDDSQAESKYNYETTRIARQDNMLEMEIQQLETQHEAVLKELESVRKVIDNNIERTFKLFSNS